MKSFNAVFPCSKRAAEGFPGVFARIGEFDDWLTGIYQGIAITQRLDFHVVATEQAQSTSIRVSNNSEVDASVSYEIDEENGFSLVDGECSSINAGESCQLTVNFSNSDIGSFDAKLEIETDNRSFDNGQITDPKADIILQIINLKNSKIKILFSKNNRFPSKNNKITLANKTTKQSSKIRYKKDAGNSE